MVGVERRDFSESEGCGYEVEDCTANQTADGKPDEAGEESRIEAARHEREDTNSNNTGETDQGDHEQAVTPDLRAAWFCLAQGEGSGIEGGKSLNRKSWIIFSNSILHFKTTSRKEKKMEAEGHHD